jgi:hypothetical protein
VDGQGPDLARLRAALVAFDDEALAALANKGLVRRARKDLESNPPVSLEPSGDRPRLAVGDGVVELALPPSRSTCSCPAGGVCRHILAALIYVRDSAPVGGSEPEPEAGPSVSAIEEMMAVDDAAIASWAGKPLAARAVKALALGMTAEVEEAGAVVVRFPSRNVVCRWMPGGGLTGMVCSCHAPGPCEHRVAAVLAVQTARGVREPASEPEALAASAGAPRTREEVLASLGEVLRDLVALGTSRLSRATAGRLRTLAVSAHGVDFPRLVRLVRTLADEVDHGLARDAQADSSRVLAAAARVEALRHALARPTPALVGEHRSRYEPVGDIEIVGLGARRWRARSGYEGLTLYFWDRSARAWASWTEARPTTTGGFDPAARFDGDGPWAGLASPSQASRSALRLTGAWRNRHGRLSGRPSTRASVTGPVDPAEAPVIERWHDLLAQVNRLFGGGFRDRDERDGVVLLAPKLWAPAQFGPIRQEVVRFVFDADGRPLPLVIPHTPENQDAVGALEKLDPSGVRTVLGLLRLEADRLAVEPVAVRSDKSFLNLTLDAEVQPVKRPGAATERVGDDPEERDDEEETPTGRSTTPLGVLLGRLASALEAVGEGGLAAFRGVDELRGLAERADSVGLAACARAAARVVDHLELQRRGEPVDDALAAHDLLRACYVVRLALVQESVATATALIGARPPA